ncbi:Hypothetical protein P9303_25861 [Prochlorococcus marinus str. MIT 9303]|uniref:Uncharacterized protein n=1 Tax=Prochlorococcus marinus (strain MIT 9303) TaxID=59922 RepID=A2CCV7_PROM3|nr:Hypothetical protein P9303_25861 [Prochlorococcus marinus str. MIT 9303]
MITPRSWSNNDDCDTDANLAAIKQIGESAVKLDTNTQDD